MYFTQYVKQLPQYESKLVCLWGLPLTLLGTEAKMTQGLYSGRTPVMQRKEATVVFES